MFQPSVDLMRYVLAQLRFLWHYAQVVFVARGTRHGQPSTSSLFRFVDTYARLIISDT